MKQIRNAAAFFRVKVAAGITLLALAGALEYGPPLPALAIPMLSVFLAYSAAYAFNNVTDVREDRANGREISPLARGKSGRLAILSAYALSILLAYYVNMEFFALVSVVFALSLAYSHFRVKRFPALKNAYTGLSIGLAYLAGSLAFSPATPQLFWAYLFVSAYAAVLSMILDIRDIPGDRRLGIRTIAVLMGGKNSRMLVSALLLLLSIPVILMFPKFILFPVFFFIGAALLMLGKYHLSHMIGALAFIAYICAALVS